MSQISDIFSELLKGGLVVFLFFLVGDIRSRLINVEKHIRAAQLLRAADTSEHEQNLPAGHSGSSLECMHPFCVAEREQMRSAHNRSERS